MGRGGGPTECHVRFQSFFTSLIELLLEEKSAKFHIHELVVNKLQKKGCDVNLAFTCCDVITSQLMMLFWFLFCDDIPGYVKFCDDNLCQGSQTQTDSRAAWDLKQDLAGRIEKVKKNYLKFCFLVKILLNIGKNDLKFIKILIFPNVGGPHWTLSRTACLRPLI